MPNLTDLREGCDFIEEQRAISVFLNESGHVVIRQEGLLPNEDNFVVIQPLFINKLIWSLRALAKEAKSFE